MFYWSYYSFVALCSPECTLTTDTCASLNNCKCGTADPCGPTLSNRCLNSVCVCGVSASCTSGTTVPVCLDQVGNTPGSTNTVATWKVSKPKNTSATKSSSSSAKKTKKV